MNRKMQKILSFVLTLCMLLSNVPFAAFAAETAEANTTNGYYDESGNWQEGGTGSITHTLEDGTKVILSKTAAQVAENTFEITLKVETSTTTTIQTDGGAVVLVIDRSNSMKYCADCGGNGSHKNTCGHYSRYGNSVSTAQNRMTAAKGAALSFLASYAGTDASANRMLCIVTFDTDYRVHMDWVNVAGGEGKNGYNTASDKINGISIDGGTNLEGGLKTALDQLPAVSQYSARSVVLLTDGVPTYRINGGNGRQGSEDNNNAAANQATAIKDTGAKLYTVCFGVANDETYSGGPTVGNFLSGSVASPSCAYNADNTSELYGAFAAITESITSGLDGLGLTATDPMADMISVTGGTGENFFADGDAYTWKLGNAEVIENGNQKTYIYTYTYTVELYVQDPDFKEGAFFPTNEPTYLNLADGTQLEFPVPGVKGKLPRTDVSVTKVWDDNENQDGIRPTSVTVQLMEGTTEIGEPVELNAANGWSYTWDVETYGLIAMSQGKARVYTVKELDVPDDYKAKATTEGYAITLTNSHEVYKTAIEVTKVWDDADNQDGIRPASITVKLLADGVEIASASLKAEDGWKYTFDGLDVNKNGKAIVYTVVEEPVEGYTTNINGYVVTNTHEVEKTEVSVKKVWDDADNQDGKRSGSVTIRLLADNVDTGKTLVLSDANGWSGTFTELDKYSNAKEINYTISEDEVAGYTADISGNAADGYIVTNTHVPEVTTLSGTKTWEDNNDQDGKRPSSITIHLLANGTEVASKTVTADNWSWTFENMPKYAGGQLISYTVKEDNVEGYTPSYDGLNVTNTHTPDQTSIDVTKVWEDANNQDGKRPNNITVVLVADGTATENKLVLDASNNWHGVFSGLDVYKAGKKIEYTVQEIKVAEYDTKIDGNASEGYVITNTHEVELVNVAGSKTWDDANNQDGKRPGSITINLLADGVKVDSKTVTASDGWKWDFQNLPKYKEGKEIVYTITENAVDNYGTKIDGYDVTNSYTPEQTSVTVIKFWDDNDNQDGIRPNSVTVRLLADGVEVASATLNSGNEWTHTFSGLDVYKAGKKIVYKVTEDAVDEYTTSIDGDAFAGYTITNSHTPYTTKVEGVKTWNDNNNQDGKRPSSITINLLADGVKIDSKVVTAADGWKWSFTDLPVNKEQGTQIKYTITEDAVDEYKAEINGFNVTNTHDIEKVNVSVTKGWEDSNDQDGIRPDFVTVVLLANGVEKETLNLTESNKWAGQFTDLDKYENGKEIKYTVKEIVVPGYETVITGNAADGFIITNSHNPETIKIEGAKTWDDADNQDGKRPESITIRLLADGAEKIVKKVSEADNWSWSFENLPKYRDHGVEIVYTITEDAFENYSSSVNGFNVTNTHAPEMTSVSVSKTWEDNNDQDGKRPESITVALYGNDKQVAIATLNEGNGWAYTFTELPVYEAGQVIEYTVDELEVPGYEKVITGNPEKGFHITNSYTPETTVVSGAKTWEDNNNQDGKRPESITITLLKDGVEEKTIEVTAENNWSWSFENLPKYRDHGTLINYSIKEMVVDEYTTVINGYDVTNTHAPEKTSVTVTKAWADSDDQDGIRPEEVIVVLLANDEKTDVTLVLNDGNNWTDTFTDLDKYADGEEIVYTVEEEAVVGYEPVITGNQNDGFTITNTHTPATVSFFGEKTWKDHDNQDGARPTEITINLLANGKVIKSITVTEEDNWEWMFEDLPEFENHGEKISYSVTEEAVEGYTTEYDGFNVINTHDPEKVSVTVVKRWEDNNDQDGIRPEKITVVLLANGEKTREKLVLSEDNNWTASFTDLDKFAKGEEIVYSVSEIEVEGYETVITGDMTDGYTITNSHNTAVTQVAGSKTWNDADNQDGKRPETITVNLMKDGKVIATKTVSEADNWSWTFDNLPMYENHGVEIVYTVTEVAVEGYTTTYDGYNITNSYTPAEVSLTVTKAWADSNDEDGIRPRKVTILLFANGELTDETLVLTADGNWSGSFVGLPKYANGAEIVYTIGEVAVEGYNAVIRGDMANGFVVTNSHTVIPQTGDERTPIMWIFMMLASVAAAAYVGFDTKKKRNVK